MLILVSPLSAYSHHSHPKSERECIESSRNEMRELSPARDRQRKKLAARNRPTFMVLYRIGILCGVYVHNGYNIAQKSQSCRSRYM